MSSGKCQPFCFGLNVLIHGWENICRIEIFLPWWNSADFWNIDELLPMTQPETSDQLLSNLYYKVHPISKLECFLARFEVIFAQSIEAKC